MPVQGGIQKKTTKKSAAKRSGNPAKRAAASSVSDFKKKLKSMTLELPSGLVVEARRIRLESLVRQGQVPNSLLPIVEKALKKGSSVDVQELVGDDVDMEKIQGVLDMMDELVVATVTNPKVHSTPEDEDERDDELLYVDELDDEDKMFLFQWAIGGTADLEQFRVELQSTLGSVAQGQGDGNSTE